MNIENCNFYGVKYSDLAVEVLNTLGKALLENAKAIGNLSHVLKASNITIESMIKIESEENDSKQPTIMGLEA